MKEERSEKLIKRIKTDMFCSWVIAAGFFMIIVYYLVSILKGGTTGDIAVLVRMTCIFIAQAMLSMVLSSVAKNGRPFIAGNVRRIRAMAIVLLASFPLEIVISMAVSFSGKANSSGCIEIDFTGLMIMFLGAVIGIISEIFFYGKKLEEEMDQIA